MTRVLIVEDDASIRETMEEALACDGYEVSLARNGLEGLDALHGACNFPKPDLVLLDLMMPDINGWEFLNLKNDDATIADIPVIVITAASCHEARVGDPRHVLLIVHKPFSLDALLTVVGRALQPKPTSSLPSM